MDYSTIYHNYYLKSKIFITFMENKKLRFLIRVFRVYSFRGSQYLQVIPFPSSKCRWQFRKSYFEFVRKYIYEIFQK